MSKAIHFNLLFTEIFSLSFFPREFMSSRVCFQQSSRYSFISFFIFIFSSFLFTHRESFASWNFSQPLIQMIDIFYSSLLFSRHSSWKLLRTGIFLAPKLVIIYSAMYYFDLVLCLRSSRIKWREKKLCCEFYCKIKMCLKQWADTLLKAYPMNVQINSFDLWVDVG